MLRIEPLPSLFLSALDHTASGHHRRRAHARNGASRFAARSNRRGRPAICPDREAGGAHPTGGPHSCSHPTNQLMRPYTHPMSPPPRLSPPPALRLAAVGAPPDAARQLPQPPQPAWSGLLFPAILFFSPLKNHSSKLKAPTEPRGWDRRVEPMGRKGKSTAPHNGGRNFLNLPLCVGPSYSLSFLRLQYMKFEESGLSGTTRRPC